jgi:uncharacterized integral membrane protein
MKLAGAIWSLVGVVLLFVVLIFGMSVLGGITIKLLWGWFVTPLGVPGLSLFHAMGLVLLVGFLTYRKADHENELKTKDKLDEALARVLSLLGERIMLVAFTISFGYLFHLLMS